MFLALVPVRESLVFVIISTSETAAIEESASPRKPRVTRLDRSASLAILEVACLRKAFVIWSASMPQPLSVTRTRSMPPFLISIVMAVAPASIAFSVSSLTTLTGRSTTSPAAILLIVSLSNT